MGASRSVFSFRERMNRSQGFLLRTTVTDETERVMVDGTVDTLGLGWASSVFVVRLGLRTSGISAFGRFLRMDGKDGSVEKEGAFCLGRTSIGALSGSGVASTSMSSARFILRQLKELYIWDILPPELMVATVLHCVTCVSPGSECRR